MLIQQARADNLTLFVIIIKKLIGISFQVSVLLQATLSKQSANPLGYCLLMYSNYMYYFDNVMTKFMINNRTDAWKTDVNLLKACHASNPSSNPVALRKVCYKPKLLISYLHISIFNAIMDHLNKMSSTISTNLNTRYWNKSAIVRF